MVLMENKSTCYSNIVLSSAIFVHNGIGKKVLGVTFAYPKCKGGWSFDFELCMAINSINTLGNAKNSRLLFVIKHFNFYLIMINSNFKLINYDQLWYMKNSIKTLNISIMSLNNQITILYWDSIVQDQLLSD